MTDMSMILSPEELAAMEAYDADENTDDIDQADQTDADTDDGPDADDADSSDDADNDEDDADDAVTEESEADPEPEAAKAEAKPDEPTPVAEPQPVAEPAPSVLDKLNADLVALKKQFDDGEVSIDEYIDAKSALDRQIVKAELKAELAQESVNKSWEQSQKDFLGQNTYLRDSDVLHDAFAMQVNRLLADPKSAALSDAELLAAAKAKVDAAFGRKADPEPSAKPEESPVRKAKKEAAKAPVPKTLGGVPSAKAADVGQDEFAHLDALTGEKRESAVARMTPEQMSRWLHQ